LRALTWERQHHLAPACLQVALITLLFLHLW
jgi:hypothetical protein